MLSRAHHEMLIQTVGVPMVFHQAKAPHTVTPLSHAGIASPRKDSEIVNSYGVGAKVITLMEVSVPSVPEKFDWVVVTSGGEKLVFEAVTKVHEPGTGTVIGYRCFVRGK